MAINRCLYQCHTPAALPRADLDEPGHMSFLYQQSMQRHPLHTPRISQNICLRMKIWFVVLLLGQKQDWPSSNFDSDISWHFLSRHLEYTFPERLSSK